MINRDETTCQSERVAIIGSGPRGMSVLERLAALLIELNKGEAVEVFLIDDGYVGTGRVWSTTQSPLLLMNTVAQEISAFSGLWDFQEARPGNGPSFAQWWKLHHDDYESYGGYAPRAYYGEYLMYVLSAIERALPSYVILHKVSARVERLEEIGNAQLLHFSNGEVLPVDRTVLATGHPINRLQPFEQALCDFASRTPGVDFIQGDSVAGMDFSSIAADQHVGIIGMGLSFYDLMMELTVGRGGQFLTEEDGSMRYCSSGREPHIYAGSRSGMPVPVRGRNQKPFDYEYHPVIFTQERAAWIRQRGDVHFDRDVLPLLEAEIALVYAETKLRMQKGEAAARRLLEEVDRYEVDAVEGVHTIARLCGLSDPVGIRLNHLAAPFKGCKFSSLDVFNDMLLAVLAEDYKEAMQGNVNSPIKASLDVIRNTRSVVRTFVDFGGLHPDSHRVEFMGQFHSISSFLAAGPPAFRSLQLRALIKEKIVTVMGPSLQLEMSSVDACYYMSSPYVQHSRVALQALIDGRIPATDITRDCSSLTQNLLKQGIYVPFVNRDGDASFETGGVAVTPSPFHPVRVNGTIADHLYVLGIPTEYTRWFMQSGSSRPHKWIDFMIDADAIARHVLQCDLESSMKHQPASTTSASKLAFNLESLGG